MANISFMKEGIQLCTIRNVHVPHAAGDTTLLIAAAVDKISEQNGVDIIKGEFKAGRDWDEARVDGRRVTADMYNSLLLKANKQEIQGSGNAPATLDNSRKTYAAPKTIPNWTLE